MESDTEVNTSELEVGLSAWWLLGKSVWGEVKVLQNNVLSHFFKVKITQTNQVYFRDISAVTKPHKVCSYESSFQECCVIMEAGVKNPEQ